MNLLVKGAGFREGYVKIAGPGDGARGDARVRTRRCGAGSALRGRTADREVVFDIISGVCRLEWPVAVRSTRLADDNPFSAGPTLICLPPGTRYCFTALTPRLDMAVSLTPADPGLPVAILGPNDIPKIGPAQKTGPGRSVPEQAWRRLPDA